ncbi:MAG TPA: GNAT family N-acetyltransferase [Solirubrobacterales bacterium]|nr:GNAT family N-acetyltransferase [Solirubrobacterales bacterium]
MSKGRSFTQPFDSGRHDVAGFGCGQEALDRWLKRSAGQAERRDSTRTFVVAEDDGAVVGYYTLVAGEVEHGEASVSVRKGLPRHFPIPVAILARFAVDARRQREGLGAKLLHDALERICRAAQEVAVRAVVVHAIDEGATAFYERFGFRPLGTAPRTLMVTLADLRRAGYVPRD